MGCAGARRRWLIFIRGDVVNGSSKTAIMISSEVRASYEAMRADYPHLTLTEFCDMGMTFLSSVPR